MNFDTYKFRPSQVGILMTNGRDKSDPLGETVKNYLSDCYIQAKYKRSKDITSKFLEKGLMVEEDAITLYTDFKNELFFKNEKRFDNDFLIGTPDIVTRDRIIDIKSSWDIFTFAKSIREENKIYWWQLQAYMALTGKQNATLVYCLVDTPESIIQREIKKAYYQSGLSEDNESYKEYVNEMISYYRYEDIPTEKRIIEKHYTFDAAKMDELYARIEQCRNHLNSLNF